MMAYILIVLLNAYGSDGGNAMTTARFENKEACVAAGREIEAFPLRNRTINYRCVSAQ